MNPPRIAILMMLLALLANPMAAHADEQSLQEELQQLQARVHELEAENTTLRQTVAELTAEKSTPATDTQLADENSQLKEQLAKIQNTNEDLEMEKQHLEQLAGVTVKGESVESKLSLFNSIYHEDVDRTAVISAKEQIKDVSAVGQANYYFYTGYVYAGREMAAPPEDVQLKLVTIGRPTDRLKHVKSARFVLDNESLELHVAEYDRLNQKKSAGISRGSRGGVSSFDEQITFVLGKEDLRRIARARTVQIEFPNLTLTLNGDQIATFLAIQKRFELGI